MPPFSTSLTWAPWADTQHNSFIRLFVSFLICCCYFHWCVQQAKIIEKRLQFVSSKLFPDSFFFPWSTTNSVNSSHLINADWLTTVEQFASGISQYPSDSSTSTTCWRWYQVLLEAWGLPEGSWDKKNTERDQRQSGETQRGETWK